MSQQVLFALAASTSGLCGSGVLWPRFERRLEVSTDVRYSSCNCVTSTVSCVIGKEWKKHLCSVAAVVRPAWMAYSLDNSRIWLIKYPGFCIFSVRNRISVGRPPTHVTSTNPQHCRSTLAILQDQNQNETSSQDMIASLKDKLSYAKPDQIILRRVWVAGRWCTASPATIMSLWWSNLSSWFVAIPNADNGLRSCRSLAFETETLSGGKSRNTLAIITVYGLGLFPRTGTFEMSTGKEEIDELFGFILSTLHDAIPAAKVF